MFELEPGPIARLDPAQVRPFPPRSSFEGLVADRLGQLAGVDAAMGARVVRITESHRDDIEALYAQTIGVAALDASAEYAATASSPVPRLVDLANNADVPRQAVLRYLPPPTAAITTSLIDPPRLPGGRIGSGGWEGAPTAPPGQIPDFEAAVRASIRYLYLTLLNREPDQGGWDAWTRDVIVGGHTLAWVREGILASDEYRRTHGG